MSKIRPTLLVVLTFLLVQPISASAGETILQKGHSFVMRISGVPADEVALVSQKYGISDEGTIRLPYLKVPLVAAGLKPSVLARKIEAAYKKAQIYTRPTIQVSVSELPEERFVSVIGEVRQSGKIGFISGLSILDAIAQCGGFTDFANKKSIKLTRGTKVTFHRLNTSDPKENVKLQPGDIVTVRSGGWLR